MTKHESRSPPLVHHPVANPYPTSAGRLKRTVWWIDATVTVLMGLVLMGLLYAMFWLGHKARTTTRKVSA